MTHLLRITCLISAILSLSACSIGGEKAAVPAAPSAVAANTAATTITPTITGSPSPSYQEAYPGVATIEMDAAYPVPTSRWTPGPETEYPAGVLTLTATAPTPTYEQSPTLSGQALPDLPDPCKVYAGQISYPVPDLANLRWENVFGIGKTARRLTGLSAPSSPPVPSPDGPGFALSIDLGTKEQSVRMGLLVVNGPGANPWWAIQPGNAVPASYQWLPGNRLIWLDGGKLYSARADGSQRIRYPYPEPIYGVWSNGKTAMVSAETHLALLDLAANTWTVKVTNISRYLSAVLAPDGGSLLINDSGTLIQVPMDPRGKVVRYKTLQYQGSGGFIGSPIVLGDSRYIFPGELELTNGPDTELRFMVFKTGEYEPIPVETLIGNAEVQNIYAASASEDGNWVSFLFQSANPSVPNGLYLAPSSDLKAGKIITGVKLGWRDNPPSLLLWSDDLVTQIFLPSFEERILGRFSYVTERPGLFQVRLGPDITAILNDSQLFLFNVDGVLQTKYHLPYQNQQIHSLTIDRDGEIYLAGWDGKADGEICDVTYWIEVIEEN